MCTGEDNTSTHSHSLKLADAELKPMGLSRRRILRSAGILAAGTAASAAMAPPAFANAGGNDPQLSWLVGDHHVHTQYSHGAKYLIKQQLDAAQSYGVDWLACCSRTQRSEPPADL